MAELLTKKVLFQGTGELDQIDKIFKVLGSPTEETWPGHKELENVKKVAALPGCGPFDSDARTTSGSPVASSEDTPCGMSCSEP